MGFMMLLVIGVVVIIALKIAHIPRSATVSALAGVCQSSACLEIVCVFMMQAFIPLNALSFPLSLQMRLLTDAVITCCMY